MEKFLVLISLLLFTTISFAEEAKTTDPFDLSASSSKVNELGVVTQPEVDALEVKAKEFFNAGEYKSAIPILVEYSKKANWLANMITATLAPYYGASYDDKKAYPYTKIKPLVSFETLANDYKKKRNIALAMQGECLLKIGDKKGAIPVLLKALDLFSIDSEDWWERTRNNLLEIIEVE